MLEQATTERIGRARAGAGQFVRGEGWGVTPAMRTNGTHGGGRGIRTPGAR